MLDTPDVVKAKIARAVTDSNVTFNPDEMSAGVANLVTIIKVMAGDAGTGIVEGLTGQGYGALKKAATDAVVAGLEPIQQRYHALRSDEATLEEILERGAERARGLAAPKVKQVKDAVGLG